MLFKKIRIAVIISQSIFFGCFIFVFIRSIDPFSTLTNPFLRFDPITFLSNISINPMRIGIISGVILLTLLLGRFFCGWICPLGYLIDLIDLIISRLKGYINRIFIKKNAHGGKLWVIKQQTSNGRSKPESSSKLKSSAKSKSGKTRGFTGFTTLYPPSLFLLGIVMVTVFTPVPLFQFLHPGIWIVRIFTLHITGIAFLIFLFGISIITRRFWCRYLCPLGALYGLLSGFSIFKLKIRNCSSCGSCSSCPMGAILKEKNYIVNSQCILCFEFESKCRTNGIVFSAKSTSSKETLTLKHGLFHTPSKKMESKGHYPESQLKHGEYTITLTTSGKPGNEYDKYQLTQEASAGAPLEDRIYRKALLKQGKTGEKYRTGAPIFLTIQDLYSNLHSKETKSIKDKPTTPISEKSKSGNISIEHLPEHENATRTLMTRRKFLTTGLILTGSVAVGLALPGRTHGNTTGLLRPPGVTDEVSFVKKCLRCQQCVRSCPNGIIKPTGLSKSLKEGIENLYTPHLEFIEYGCDYYCQVCQIVCPNNAIPLQSLEEKQKARIGIAKIDENLCIVFKEKKNCIVCEEFCPVPEKAVKLKDKIYQGPDGSVKLRYPMVIEELCIGCGICEAMCPVDEKAIRVFKDV